ncbi:MAG: polyphosphate kinase 2 family protein [Cyclobacteriaceae bacterium]|nr:polyphosphate kinase 2 family protein [Cyclobacteriaceae bacterium]
MTQSHRFDLSQFIVKPGKYTPLASFDPGYTGQLKGKKHSKTTLKEDIDDLAAAQELLWASKQFSLLIIFQAMDAAGKDGTIKHVMSGINPQGCDVFSFKAPTEEERLHHFLWRPEKYLPPRGKIAIFNRSYYEEVLVVRVHPQFLATEWLPIDRRQAPLEQVWQSRYEEINEFEKRITKNGITVIKFFLNVSKEEQLKRFISRLENTDKNWKFSASDFEERKYWNQYQEAYELMVNATSTAHAPWYIVPADNKWYLRAVVADVITARIAEMDLKFPEVSAEKIKKLTNIREQLQDELKYTKGKK